MCDFLVLKVLSDRNIFGHQAKQKQKFATKETKGKSAVDNLDLMISDSH